MKRNTRTMPSTLHGEEAIAASGNQSAHAKARREPTLLDAIAGLFVNDSFAEEVDTSIQAERQRERDEAAREACE